MYALRRLRHASNIAAPMPSSPIVEGSGTANWTIKFGPIVSPRLPARVGKFNPASSGLINGATQVTPGLQLTLAPNFVHCLFVRTVRVSYFIISSNDVVPGIQNNGVERFSKEK